MPRLYREAPLNGIWEGSGNVIALDVLRAIVKAPDSLDALFAEIDLAAGADDRLDAYVKEVRNELGSPEDVEARARRIVERLALALQGSLVVRSSPPAVAGAFCATRIAGDWGRAYGSLPAGIDVASILERALPF
jgi:putative acyl-CoA dehydrogenase